MFTVCIDKLDAGGFRVYTEGADDQAAEPAPAAPAPAAPGAADAGMMAQGSDQAASDPGQTVQTIKEALTLAMEALKGDGSVPDHQGQSQAFQAGFAQGGM